ncbi:PadR family transcriptional regulator [Deinococcus irradiatisoli]|uniref:PadR family transcriptional regulator n=1 Tax=Deinococcus irradiatisoli TaxID=2202254 RepID=A0A2Z3JDI3_9DEIO|nr:PadR family transcriptional regulator [Deinococcus irradiatisoli]AWN23227.1 PadR family transcriptional regulator [Deinococcus irradiatisoli]
MPRPPHISPQTRTVLAQLAASHPGWAYGYDLSKATGLKSGTLYPILRRLHEAHLLDAEWEPSPHPGKPPRHIYRLSEAGLKLAHEQQRPNMLQLKGALV